MQRTACIGRVGPKIWRGHSSMGSADDEVAPLGSGSTVLTTAEHSWWLTLDPQQPSTVLLGDVPCTLLVCYRRLSPTSFTCHAAPILAS